MDYKKEKINKGREKHQKETSTEQEPFEELSEHVTFKETNISENHDLNVGSLS